jgi:cyclic pyranopterin phosphate synthase
MSQRFSHLDDQGRARMVDVGDKPETERVAVVRGSVSMSAETAQAIAQGSVAKGDVLAVARVAGIQAAKRTAELVPLCHPLMINSATVSFEVGDDRVDIEAIVSTVGRTGVEMEALTAASVAALTIYDMCKSSDRAMVIGDIALWEKSGGRSGDYRR